MLSIYYEAIRDALEIQYPITLSANEIEKIFEFNDNLDSPCSLPDIASGLSKIGFPEMEEQINAIGHPDIVVDEKTKKRGDCIFHCLSISGNVDANEEGLVCPRCGSKYVAWLQFDCYLTSKPTSTKEGNLPERAPHRLEGASNIWNKSYHLCLGCDFSFDEE